MVLNVCFESNGVCLIKCKQIKKIRYEFIVELAIVITYNNIETLIISFWRGSTKTKFDNFDLECFIKRNNILAPRSLSNQNWQMDPISELICLISIKLNISKIFSLFDRTFQTLQSLFLYRLSTTSMFHLID